jgi:hypothetical protein
MAQRVCEQCGSGIFLGEAKCANCGAPTPEDVASFGRDRATGGPTAPPPEGLNLMVQKHFSDKEMYRNKDDQRIVDPVTGDVDHRAAAESFVSMAKVERDAHGNVVWDPKHALIGGLVVAIIVGLIAGYLYYRYQVTADAISTFTEFQP